MNIVPRTQKVYIADMEDTLTQLANIVGIPRDADLLIQRVRELAALKRDEYVLVPKEPTPTMLDAGFNATSADGFTKQSAAWVYRAMIDAARGE